jgi:hypothetical protein
MAPVDEVFGRELVPTGRRRSIQTKVRQPIRPWAGNAGAHVEGVAGRLFGVVIPGAAVQRRGHGLRLLIMVWDRLDPGFLPELANHRAAEVPDEAHAVGAGHHLIERLQHAVPRRIAVHVLANQIGGLHVEHHSGNHAEGP